MASLLFLSLVSCVFLSLLPPEDQGRHTSCTFENAQIRKYEERVSISISVYNYYCWLCVCIHGSYACTHRFSVVLKSNRELTDEMLRGRLPRPSSVSSSDFFLLLTHSGKYINFSWKEDTQMYSEKEIWKKWAKSGLTQVTNAIEEPLYTDARPDTTTAKLIWSEKLLLGDTE